MFTAYRIPQLELAILQGLIDTYVYHIGQHSSREFLLSFHLKKKKKMSACRNYLKPVSTGVNRIFYLLLVKCIVIWRLQFCIL